jgi:hypothetical protein
MMTLVSLPLTLWFRNAPLVYSYQTRCFRCSKHQQYSVSWSEIQHADNVSGTKCVMKISTFVGKILGFDVLWHIFVNLSSW